MEAFDSLGARLLADRAAQELRAAARWRGGGCQAASAT